MSKIIKANHLVLVSNEKQFPDDSTDFLTPQEARDLYEETRVIIEKLLDEAKVKAAAILHQAQKEADVIVNNSKLETEQKAQEIINDALLEAEKIKQNAYNEGKNLGEKEGLDKVKDLKEEAQDVIQKAHQEKIKILASLENEIVNLAVKIAEKIIKKELTTDPETMCHMFKTTLENVQDAKQVTLKINEQDYPFINNSFQDLTEVVTQGELNIEIDNSLKSGDCLVVSDTGIILAKIDEQLTKIHAALLEVNGLV